MNPKDEKEFTGLKIYTVLKFEIKHVALLRSLIP